MQDHPDPWNQMVLLIASEIQFYLINYDIRHILEMVTPNRTLMLSFLIHIQALSLKKLSAWVTFRKFKSDCKE